MSDCACQIDEWAGEAQMFDRWDELSFIDPLMAMAMALSHVTPPPLLVPSIARF